MNGQAEFKRRTSRASVAGRRAAAVRVVVAAVAVAAILLGVGGCDDVYRVNHVHNDANAKLSQEALQSFESFASDVDGLAPTLLRNIDARQKVEQAVGDTRTRVKDVEWVNLTTDMTWERLRLETLASLGLLTRHGDKGPVALDLRDPKDLTYARVLAAGYDPDHPTKPRGDRLDDKLALRIVVREVKVSAIAKVLQLLAEAHRSEALEAAKKLKANSAELAKDDPSAAPPAAGEDLATAQAQADARMKWLSQLYTTFKKVRQDIAKNKELLGSANELQRKLLADIEKSRDPEEATALVAVVGTGLSDQDFLLLDGLLKYFDEQLAYFTKHAPEVPAGDKDDEDDRAWNGLQQTLCNAQAAIRLAGLLADQNLDPKVLALPSNAFGGGPDAVVKAIKDALDKLPSQCATEDLGADAGGTQAVSPSGVARSNTMRTMSQRAGGRAPAGADAGAPPPKPGPSRAAHAAYQYSTLLWPGGKRGGKAANPEVERKTTNVLQRINLHDTIQAISGIRKDTTAAGAKLRRIAPQKPGSGVSLAKAAARVTAKRHQAKLAMTDRQRAAIATHRADLLARIDELDRQIAAASVAGAPATDLRAAKAEKQAKQDALAGLEITDDQALKGLDFLDKFVGLDAKLADFVGDGAKSIGEDNLKYLGGVVDDIQHEQTEKHDRILRFLGDLLGAQTELAQENVRHADGMLTLANVELRRWELLGSLDEVYSEVYNFNEKRDEPDLKEAGEQFRPSLFNTETYIQTWYKAHPFKTVGGTTVDGAPPAFDPAKPELRIHPIVHYAPTDAKPNAAGNEFDVTVHSDGVLTSIRLLAETAHAWHVAPQASDLSGFHLRVANERLFQAVRTVDGHLLMLSLNQHISEDNTVRLRAELASHDVNLDSLSSRVEEAGYRFKLGDLQAFHASGITDKDVQVVSSAITNALLVWIGGNVH